MKLHGYLVITSLAIVVSTASASNIQVDVARETGEDVDDYNLDLSGPNTNQVLEEINSFERDLEEGDYTFSISKKGFEDITREITVQEDIDASYNLITEPENDTEESDIQITRLKSPESVCQSKSFAAEFDITNNANESRVVSTSGFGFREILSGKSFIVNPDETRTYRFRFTGLGRAVKQEFTVSASSIDSDSISETIDVKQCQTIGDPKSVTDIELDLYPEQGQNNALRSEVVRIRGFADGGRGSIKLNLTVNENKIRDIKTQRDGYFQTYTRFDDAGSKTVSVSTSKVSGESEIKVIPNPEIQITSSRQKVVAGEEFQICTSINSSITPKVALIRDKQVLGSMDGSNKTCFSTTAPENKGEYNYTVRTLTPGQDSSSSRKVEVLEKGEEVETFPKQVTSVETEDSLVRVKLYNTNNQERNYTTSIKEINESWVSNLRKESSLDVGERENVYFYISPSKTGNFTAHIQVESQDEIIYNEDIEVYSTSSTVRFQENLHWINILAATFAIVI